MARKYSENVHRFRTPSVVFNSLVAGGIKFGSINEFWGRFKSGKTTACYEMANSALNDYGEDARVVIIDSEASTDPARLASFNLFPGNDEIEVLEKDPRVFLHYIATIEDAIDTSIKYVNEAKKNNTPTLIIID